MTLDEVMKWLVLEGYVEYYRKKPIFTDKARAEISGIETAVTVVNKQTVAVALKGDTAESVYKQFILSCEVPSKGRTASGQLYDMNKFSQDGLKAFTEAIQKGYNLQVLALAVRLYYKSPGDFKKAIGNYMSSKEWVTDYDRLLSEYNKGNLNQYIQDEVRQPDTQWFTRDPGPPKAPGG